MANEEHLARLKQGAVVWNTWRREFPAIQPDLSEAPLFGADLFEANLAMANLAKAHLDKANLLQADLSGADLSGADLSMAYLREAHLIGADLHQADLHKAVLYDANLTRANLSRADLYEAALTEAKLIRANLVEANITEANLSRANLSGARLCGADLSGANLSRTNLYRADLSGAHLTGALLLETDLRKAKLAGCVVYGISAWGLQLQGANQPNLVITPPDEPIITVDNLEVAQFIYLLLHNEKIRGVIDTITSKAVLILGRFTPERKAVLDAVREEIRRQHLLPIMFDFTPSAGQTTLETISTLAHIARFVIADVTDAKSVLQELQAIVPHNPSVPVQPILLASQEEPGMFGFFSHYPWVLETYYYHSLDDVLASIEQIIARADKARIRSGTDRT